MSLKDVTRMITVGTQPGISKGRGRMAVSSQRRGNFDNFEGSRSLWLWEMRAQICQ